MIDKDIIKALECCKKVMVIVGCNNCPYYNNDNCQYELIVNSLDLINRQKAEIESLKCEMGKLLPKDCSYAMQMEVSNKLESQIKSEAIIEFWESLKHFIIPQKADGYTREIVLKRDIDNLVKEMTESKNDFKEGEYA